MTLATIFLIIAIVLGALVATGRVNNVAVQLIGAAVAFIAAAMLVPMV